MSVREEKMLQDLAHICRYKATSDKPAWWSAEERESLRDFLLKAPQVKREGRYKFMLDGRKVDFSRAMPILQANGLLERTFGALLGWAGNQRWILNIFNWLGEREIKKKIN